MKQKDILLLVIPFFTLVLVFIIFSIYHNSITSTISENLNVQITPISPDFNPKTISDIKAREKIIPVYELSPLPSTIPAATTSGGLQK